VSLPPSGDSYRPILDQAPDALNLPAFSGISHGQRSGKQSQRAFAGPAADAAAGETRCRMQRTPTGHETRFNEGPAGGEPKLNIKRSGEIPRRFHPLNLLLAA